MANVPQNAARRVFLLMYLTGTNTLATGKTVAVTLSKNGGEFADPEDGDTEAVEISNGAYYADLMAGDFDTFGDLVVRGEAAGCDPCHRLLAVEAATAAPSAADNAAAVWGFSLASLAALATTTVGRWLYDKLTAIRSAIGSATTVRQPVADATDEITLRKADDYDATTGQWIEFDALGWPEFAAGGVKLRISHDGTLIGSEHDCTTAVVDADTQTVTCYLSRDDLAALPYGAVADYRFEATWSSTHKATIRHGKINVARVGA